MKKLIRILCLVAVVTLPLIACKKVKDTALIINIEGDETTHLHADVKITELWLNYTTKKSKSEWIKLEAQYGTFDLARSYFTHRDTVLLPMTVVENAETFLQLRMHFAQDSTRVITMNSDTIKMTMDATGLAGIKMGINKNSFEPNISVLNLIIQADSTLYHGSQPHFVPTLKFKSFTQKALL